MTKKILWTGVLILLFLSCKKEKKEEPQEYIRNGFAGRWDVVASSEGDFEFFEFSNTRFAVKIAEANQLYYGTYTGGVSSNSLTLAGLGILTIQEITANQFDFILSASFGTFQIQTIKGTEAPVTNTTKMLCYDFWTVQSGPGLEAGIGYSFFYGGTIVWHQANTNYTKGWEYVNETAINFVSGNVASPLEILEISYTKLRLKNELGQEYVFIRE